MLNNVSISDHIIIIADVYHSMRITYGAEFYTSLDLQHERNFAKVRA